MNLRRDYFSLLILALSLEMYIFNVLLSYNESTIYTFYYKQDIGILFRSVISSEFKNILIKINFN
jgi:hypothetical protein